MKLSTGAHAVAEAAALAGQRFMLRTGQTRLRGLWARAHELAIRLIAAAFARTSRASVYVKGSFGFGDPVYGVSDIDLVIVVPSAFDRDADAHAVAEVRRRWSRLVRLFPPLHELFHVFVYDSRSLRDAVSAPAFTFGLDRRPPRAGFLGSRPLIDEMGLQERPELYGAPREWRLVGGRSADVAPPPDDADYRRLASWLELQFWWRYAFTACVDPRGPRLPYLCVKLVAEPARIWLWLAHGEQFFSRVEALNRALQKLPEEEVAFRRALELHRALPSSPEPPLAEMLAHFVRLSSLIARELCRQVEPPGATKVGLVGAAGDALTDGRVTPSERIPRLPLVDWRARTVPPPPDEVFSLSGADPRDPSALAAAAGIERVGEYPALRAENLLILPAARAAGRSHGSEPEQGAARIHRAKLRAIQCPATDPVSFAVADEKGAALFPNTSGLSARDSARRAVAEHAVWLAAGRTDRNVRGWVVAQTEAAPSSAVALGRLFTAARAALFLDSLTEAPELALTVRAVASMLAERAGGRAAMVDDAVSSYAAWRARQAAAPPAQLVKEFATIVEKLPAYNRLRPSA